MRRLPMGSVALEGVEIGGAAGAGKGVQWAKEHRQAERQALKRV